MREIKGEIITAAEALKRVGLEDLADNGYHPLVEWTGYPKPFSGHTAVYGFGPLDHPEKQEDAEGKRYGRGRRYQQLARVSQYICSGHVLFSWCAIGVSKNARGDEYHYRLNSSMVVSIDETPDNKSTCLKVGWTA